MIAILQDKAGKTVKELVLEPPASVEHDGVVYERLVRNVYRPVGTLPQKVVRIPAPKPKSRDEEDGDSG